MFLNTAIIPLAINPSRKDWFSDGGLVVEIYFNIILLSLSNPFFYYYNWSLLFRKIRIWREKRKEENSVMTQREANKMLEGTNFDIAKGYADIMMIFATTAFYTPMIPMLPVFSMFGLVLNYWLQKYFLFRKSRIPQHMGERLAMLVSANIPFIMFLYALGQYIFITKLSEAANYICLPIMIFSILYYIVPKDIFLRKCQKNVFRNDDETYLKNKHKFIIDYDRSNPLTLKEATLAHLDELEKMEKDQEELNKIEEKRRNLQDKTIFDNLKDYGQKQSLEQRVNKTYGNETSPNDESDRAKVANKYLKKVQALKVEDLKDSKDDKDENNIPLYKPPSEN